MENVNLLLMNIEKKLEMVKEEVQNQQQRQQYFFDLF